MITSRDLFLCLSPGVSFPPISTPLPFSAGFAGHHLAALAPTTGLETQDGLTIIPWPGVGKISFYKVQGPSVGNDRMKGVDAQNGSVCLSFQ